MNGRHTHYKTARTSHVDVRANLSGLIVMNVNAGRHPKIAMLSTIRAARGHCERRGSVNPCRSSSATDARPASPSTSTTKTTLGCPVAIPQLQPGYSRAHASNTAGSLDALPGHSATNGSLPRAFTGNSRQPSPAFSSAPRARPGGVLTRAGGNLPPPRRCHSSTASRPGGCADGVVIAEKLRVAAELAEKWTTNRTKDDWKEWVSKQPAG